MNVFPCYHFEIHFNIIFPPTRTFRSGLFLRVTPTKHHACHIPRQSHSSLVFHPFNIHLESIELHSIYIWRAVSSIQYTSGEQWAAFNIHLASSELHSIYIWQAVSCIQYTPGEQWAPFNIYLVSSELHSIYIWRALSCIQYISGEQWAAFNIYLASSELHSIYIWRAVSSYSIYIWRAVSCIQFLIMQFTPIEFHHTRVRPRPDVFLSTPSSDSVSQCSSLTVTQHLSHPQTTTYTTLCLHVPVVLCLKTTTGTTRHPAPNVAKSHKFKILILICYWRS